MAFAGLPRWFQQSRSQAAERGKFSDCQPLAHFRMSASRSLWDLNSSRLCLLTEDV